MSAPEPAARTAPSLLLVIDPVARRSDGESVRIAKDVLGAGASVKICLPEGPEEFARALSRRGARRPVVVGDDRSLLRAVTLLHRERELSSAVLSLVPVGGAMTLARSLGVPTDPVAAARAVLEGSWRRLDLLVDDSDGVVLGELRIPPGGPGQESSAHGHWLRACHSVVRALAARSGARLERPVRPARASRPTRPTGPGAGPARLRIEADGVTLVDLDQRVDGVQVRPCASSAAGHTPGHAHVEVRQSSPGAEIPPLHTEVTTLTVSGEDFRYRADSLVGGPVRTRTWTVRAGAWSLMLP
ncbi:diacylglycerol kinase family protein [Streptomyces tsukubensis]|uniref:Diacylglycerol kinase n=1 Tax=Streptomyces tsukubensis TaxID=83656 RepID=A0A1V4A3I6_9ACTN|nr:diacylglycerol kinase family protein [Streptomyces tsukubensis]OON74889.1 diacylglycerol kinase [Streptomyces tsukubensis]